MKLGGKGQPGEAMLARLEVWRDPTGEVKEYHEELTSDKVHTGQDFPSDVEKSLSKRKSVHSLDHGDPYYFGDPYVEDPSRFYSERRKKKLPKNLESPPGTEVEFDSPPPSPKPKGVTPTIPSPQPPTPAAPQRKIEHRKPAPVPKKAPLPSFPVIIQEPKRPVTRPSTRPPLDLDKYDYVYFNARRACTLPPRRPTPIYVDDTIGTRHKYCPSGLACIYVNKLDYGKIPQYLKERNKELGRPPEPDFRRFYTYVL